MTLLLLILAIIGHVVLMRASIDRLYTMGLRQDLWHALFWVHVVLAIVGAVWLGKVFRHTDSLDEIALVWRGYSVFCMLAVPVGVGVLVWRARRMIPACQISNHTTPLDFAEERGREKILAEANDWAARLPRNQVFTMDVVVREIRAARLPKSLDGLSILHISDLHMNGVPGIDYYQWAMERCIELRPDVIALTGDIVDHSETLEWLATTVGRLDAPLGCYFVLGNHDIPLAEDLKSHMAGLGWNWITGRAEMREHHGQRICIAGTERPWGGEYPKLEASDWTIALTHSPHQVKWAREANVDLLLAGHLHGGQIRLPLLGPAGGGRLASGLFEFATTILHVSRGLGQMAPIRFGCAPEITKLVMRSAI